MEFLKALEHLIGWLNENRPNGPYHVQITKRYHRVLSQNSAYCFIAHEPISNRTVGIARVGDILRPASWSQPARHARGSIYRPEEWAKIFGEYGIKTRLDK